MKTDQPGPAVTTPFALHKPWLRRALWALGGLLVLWVLSWLAVPPLLQSQAQLRLGALLGRQVTVGEVDFKPWSLELSVRDVAVARATPAGLGSGVPASAPQAGMAPQFTLGRLYIDMELQSLLRLAPVVDALVVDSPHLRLTHTGQGHYDVDDILARLAPPPPDPSEPATAPLRFALYNLMLSDGVVELTDAPKDKVHTLSQLKLNLPFLSNLDSKRDVLVQPALAFNLNGSQFDTTANTVPFAQTHKTDAQLQVKSLDLAPYLSYLPASLPVRLGSAVLEADLKLAFEQTDKPAVTLSGLVSASQVQISAAQLGALKPPASAELLAFERLSVQLKDVQPLRQQVKLAQVTLTQPRFNLQRNPAGMINVLALTAPPVVSNTTKSKAVSPLPERAEAEKVLKPDGKVNAASAAPTWQVSADNIALEGGEVAWLDQVPTQPAQLKLTALNLHASALTWPFSQPMPFDGSAELAGAALQFKGSATDQQAEVSAQLAAWPLSLAQPYLADVLLPRLEGSATADLGVRWAAASGQQAAQTEVQVKSLSLDKLALLSGKKLPLASIGQVLVNDVAVDLGRQSASLGLVKIVQPKFAISRAADGRWMAQDWLKAPSKPASPITKSQAVAKKPATNDQPAWQLKLNDLQLSEGSFVFLDQSTPTPVALSVAAASLQIKDFANTGKQAFGLNLSARLRHGNTEPGKLAWRGNGGLSPLALKGDLNAERLPLHALAPYLNDTLNIALLRADTSFKGRIAMAQQPSGLVLQVKGDARLEDLQTRTLAQAEPFVAAEELLNWKSLSLSGINLALAPGAATQLEVQGTVLSDFYARLILSEAGRLNLQNMTKTAAAQANQGEDASKDIATAPAPVVSAPLAAASAPAGTALAPVIHFGPVSLLGGHINFTDRFIKPNYSADLTELVGKLSAFSSQTAAGEIQLADLELRGRAEGSATLEVLGKINPLVKPIALDIQGKVRDLELAPLSTYSARYAGYGIERGKLSVDVAYKVLPDGQLTANNKLVLNQLKFGDKDPNATTSLPVKLAVALLADRNGVIDIDLPISGSLNDPQFRLMPIIFKIIGNLIVKAITAPFSLLASALGGGGGDELSMVTFDAGSAVLSDQAKVGLDKVAKALTDRPALKMTVVGTASLEVERDDFKRQQLQALVQGEKRRNQPAGDGKDAAAPVKVSAEEYPALLKAVYKRGDFPKPRNLIGLTKDIPVPEMEALLLAHLDASEAAMQALAVKRGVVVRDYLASLKLPAERLFLGAAKAVAPESKWRPRAELNLATE